MPLDNGEIFKSLVNHTPYLLVAPSQVEWCRREFPGMTVKVYETVPFAMETIQRAPRNRHERRKARKAHR